MSQSIPTLVALDHLVLTVADIAATVVFYEQVLGMTAERFQTAQGDTRWALRFGRMKINLQSLSRNPRIRRRAAPICVS